MVYFIENAIYKWMRTGGYPRYIEISTYPLVNVYITMENHHFEWVNQRTKWAMFNSTVLFYQRVTGVSIWLIMINDGE